MKKTIAFVSALLLLMVFLTSCGSDGEMLNVDYFDADYRAKNKDFFPNEGRSRFTRIYAPEVDPGMSSELHYVVYDQPNCGEENRFESHTYIWESCLKNALIPPKGGVYHGVRYRCLCGHTEYVFLKCSYQDINCDGRCINYGQDYTPGEEQ